MPHSHGEAVNRPDEAKTKQGHDIIHGTQGNEPQSSHVDRADKTAPLPEHEKGAGLKDASAAGFTVEGHDQGRPGQKEPLV